MADAPDREDGKEPDVRPQAEEKPAWRVSGPGAADFLTAAGGLDRPETDPAKGTNLREEASSSVSAAGRRLEPDLEPPENQKERWIGTDAPDSDDRPR